MSYSTFFTLNHIESINNPECLIKFNDLIVTEGFNESINIFDDKIIVLNLDCVEAKNAFCENRSRRSTMDCTFAIQISSNNDFEMLLIELRFNYISVRNLNRQKLLDKVSGSKNSLGNGTNISHRNIFVFNKALKEQAKNRLFRMLPKIPNNYEVMDIFELNNTFIK